MIRVLTVAAAIAFTIALARPTIARAQEPAQAQEQVQPQTEPQREMRSTMDGVYTEAQADRGEKLMWDVCGECHYDEDYTGAFFEDWVGASVWDLFDSIWNTMPDDSPGSLLSTDYVDAIAYMFKLNGLPTGDEELGTEKGVLDLIKIDGDH